jgi:FKBP-type peptidyl-prolyl cis-trans isomerase FkpA
MRISSRTFLYPTLLAIALCAACTRDADVTTAAAPALDSERARISYMVGLDMAKTMAPVKDEVDIDIAIAAIRAVHAGQKPALDEAQTEALRQQFGEILRKQQELAMRELARKNLAAAEDFLAKNAKAAGVTVTASGLQYRIVRDANGPKPVATDTVRVNYASTTLAGAKLESTYDTDHPAEIALNRVFPGWSEGVQLMPVGSKLQLWIPPALAYGERGAPGRIEPNALLVFDVELLEIAGKAAPEHAHDEAAAGG